MGHMPYYIQINNLVIICGIGLCLQRSYVILFYFILLGLLLGNAPIASFANILQQFFCISLNQ
jgi:hypothetical protein